MPELKGKAEPVMNLRQVLGIERPIRKQRILDADALDAAKVAHSELVLPPANLPAWPAQPRALRTPLTDQLEKDPDAVDPGELRKRLVGALQEGRGHQLLPFTGQSAALITDVAPAAESSDDCSLKRPGH